MQISAWIAAARLRTLPLSVSGIIMGCGLANFSNSCKAHLNLIEEASSNYTIFFLCLLTTISFQVLSNFANDYGDGVKGTDAHRIGETRMVASGAISPKSMKTAMVLTAAISIILSILTLYFAFGTENYLSFSVFIILGIASIAAAIKYTVGKNAYGYLGFGDLFVFLFFGLLSTAGSYFLYTQCLPWDVFLPASTIGLLSVAVLNLNNMRDQVQDQQSNKITLVVKLGNKNAKKYHFGLIIIAIICALIFVLINFNTLTQFLPFIVVVPLAIHLNLVQKTKDFAKLDAELKKVALSTFLFAILFAILN